MNKPDMVNRRSLYIFFKKKYLESYRKYIYAGKCFLFFNFENDIYVTGTMTG
jgi:hypothetical protein